MLSFNSTLYLYFHSSQNSRFSLNLLNSSPFKAKLSQNGQSRRFYLQIYQKHVNLFRMVIEFNYLFSLLSLMFIYSCHTFCINLILN